MKKQILIAILSTLFFGCSFADSDSRQVDSSEYSWSKEIETLESADGKLLNGYYLIRINRGLFPIPSNFVLLSSQLNGKLFRATHEIDPTLDAYMSAIWIWNRGEEMSDLLQRSVEVPHHQVAEIVSSGCSESIKVSYVSEQHPKYEITASYFFVEFADEVIAFDASLEKLMVAIFGAYVQINC